MTETDMFDDPKPLRTTAFAAAAAALALCTQPAAAVTEQEKHVVMAEKTLSNFLRDPNMGWLQENLHRVKGLILVPKVVKAGFIFGGSGGRAVHVARNASGRWVGPAFYTLATASVGFQAGLEVSEVAILVMTDRGANSLLATNFKLGGDASIAAGPVGVGTKASIPEDFVAFSRSKGLYGGLNLDGTAVSTADDWNKAYYKREVLPPDILIGHLVHNSQADRLLKLVADAARPK
jgi:lipid-binding SYLF domain-containing protein